jgi:hypothetical protein
VPSFLVAFKSICHALEAAAVIAAPIVQTLNPAVGGLLSAAAAAAVGVEAAVTQPGSGDIKAAVVAAQTEATIKVANGILSSQGRAPLPADTAAMIAQQLAAVVVSLNAVQRAVAVPPAAVASAAGS